MKARVSGLVFGGLGYGLALFLIVQLATAEGFPAGLGLPVGPVRTGNYDSRSLEVAAVDPNQMDKAVAEAAGGPPTVASPPPQVQASSDASGTSSQAATGPAGPRLGSLPASGPPTAAAPTTLAAFIATLPPAWQAQIQAALSKPRSQDD